MVFFAKGKLSSLEESEDLRIGLAVSEDGMNVLLLSVIYIDSGRNI